MWDDLTRLAAGLDGLIDALMIGSLAAEAHDQRRADVCAQAEINENLRHTLEVGRQLAAALMMEVADGAWICRQIACARRLHRWSSE